MSQPILTRDVDIRGEHQGIVRILRQDHHRNGVGGAGFVVTLFDVEPGMDDAEHRIMHMVAISFDGEGRQAFIERTGVLEIGLLVDGIIDFGANSWRGSDHYGPIIADAYEQESQRKGWGDPWAE